MFTYLRKLWNRLPGGRSPGALSVNGGSNDPASDATSADAIYARARERMVAEQLAARGIGCPRVLEALAATPRERFVLPSAAARAYDDSALAIACEQTISQPYMVGLMTERLELAGGERVLEIGVGSGYQTAVLLAMGARVWGLERHAPLAAAAERRLSELGYSGFQVRHGDGYRGWPEEAPFDRILVAAAAESCPAPLWEQLAEGGVLVGPFGRGDVQTLEIHRKRNGRRHIRRDVTCRFVPLLPDLA